MSSSRLPTITFAILGVGCVLTLGSMIWGGDPCDPDWWLAIVLLGTWVIIPYAVLGALTHFFRRSSRSVRALLAGSAVNGLVALYMVFVYVVESDAQSGLFILVLPFWQLLFTSPFLVVAFLRRSRKWAGSCRKCGYCLKGLDSATTCPECGCNIQVGNVA